MLGILLLLLLLCLVFLLKCPDGASQPGGRGRLEDGRDWTATIVPKAAITNEIPTSKIRSHTVVTCRGYCVCYCGHQAGIMLWHYVRTTVNNLSLGKKKKKKTATHTKSRESDRVWVSTRVVCLLCLCNWLMLCTVQTLCYVWWIITLYRGITVLGIVNSRA